MGVIEAMKIPSIRFYLDEDYEDVEKLFLDHGYEDIPRRRGLLGASLVAHDEETGDVVAFVWALVAEGVPVAYVDHLVIKKNLRTSSVGLVILMTLAAYLRDVGVEEILAITRPHNVAYIRMLKRRGAKDRGSFTALSLSLVEQGEEVATNGRE